MQLLEVKNDIAKILYSPSEKQLLLADFVLLEDINQSLICQIIGIESAENDNMNIATVRLSLSISKNSNLTTYNGYIPSKDSNVIYISPQEIAQLIKSSKTNLYWGKLSSHNDVSIYLGLNFLRDKAYIRCDSFDNSVLLSSNIIYNLQFNKKRTVVFDSEGSFRHIAPVSMLTLGKDFKLPLDVQAFEFIASNDLTECSIESKAFIQGILIELEEYAQSLEEKFIPFSLFKKVVEEQARFSSIPELMILRNKILRYEQAGIFAETASQFKIFREYLAKSTITTLDVSGVDEKYHKLVLKTIASQINKKCYLIVNANDTNADKSTISQIYDNTNIRPVITTSYDFKYSNLLKSYCKNLVLFAPVDKRRDEDVYSVFLQKLRNKEFIIYGENTFYMPLVIKLEVFDKNVFDKLLDYEIKDEGGNLLFRGNKTAKTPSDSKPEKKIYNALAPKNQPPKQEFGDIITQEMQLSNNFEPSSVNDNPDEYIHDAILKIPDEEFLNLGISLDAEQKNEIQSVINLDEQEPVQQQFDFVLKDTEAQTVSEEPEIEPIIDIKDDITPSPEPAAGETQVPSSEETPEPAVEEIQESSSEETRETKEEISVDETKTEEQAYIEQDIFNFSEPEVIKDITVLPLDTAEDTLIVDEPEKLTEVKDEVKTSQDSPAVKDKNTEDVITDEDLDFLDELEVSDADDTQLEEIKEEPSPDDNTIFEEYVQETNSDKTEPKVTYTVPKVAYQARNELKDILDIPEIPSDKYDFIESVDSTEPQPIVFLKEETEPSEQIIEVKPEEEKQEISEITEDAVSSPVVVENKKDNTVIPDEVIDEEDLAFLDEMINSSKQTQEETAPEEKEEVKDDNKNKLVEAIDEYKIDDTPIEINDEVVIKNKDAEDYTSQRITTDEEPIEIQHKDEDNASVQIISDDEEVSLKSLTDSEVNLDVKTLNESMELASGLSSENNDNTEDIVPIEFIGLTDDDMSVLDSTNSEVLQISEEDKNVDIYELQAASYPEEVDTEGLTEDFINAPENFSESEQDDDKDEENEPTEEDVPAEETASKPVVVVEDKDEDDEETPVEITQEEVISPPKQQEEIPLTPKQVEKVVNTTLSEAVVQNVHLNTPDEPINEVNTENVEEESNELISAINDNFDNDDEDSEDKLFADFSIDESAQVRKDKINVNVEHIKDNETPAAKVSQERRRTVEQSRQIPTPKQSSPISQPTEQTRQDIPVYAANTTVQQQKSSDGIDYAVGDWVFHPKYGRGQVESFAHYSNKILFCTILFDNFGRRTLDARLTGLEKVK